MNRGRRIDERVELPCKWWDRLIEICRYRWKISEEEPPNGSLQDKVYAYTKISKSSFLSARRPDKESGKQIMTGRLFATLTSNLFVASKNDLLNLLKSPIGTNGDEAQDDHSISDYFLAQDNVLKNKQSGEFLKDRASLIQAFDEQNDIAKEVESFKKMASSALRDDNVHRAKDFVSLAIEAHINNKTLDEVSKLSILMLLHGRADLLSDNVESAVKTFVSAGAMLSHFSRYEAGRFLTDSGRVCFHHGQTHGGLALLRSVKIYKRARRSLLKRDDPKDWAKLKNYTGEAYRILGRRNEDSKSQDWFDRAKKEYESALTVFEFEELEYEVAKVTCNLALILKYRGGIEDATDGVTYLDKACTMFEETLNSPEIRNDPLRTAKIHHYLGNTYAEWGIRSIGLDRNERLKKSIDYFELALEVYEDHEDDKRLANTQNNLANALIESSIELTEKKAVPALKEAKRLCDDALIARPEKRSPLEWAQTTTNLASALLHLSRREKGMRDERLRDAKIKCSKAANIRFRKKVHMDWVESEFLQGEIAEEIFKDKHDGITNFVAKEERRYEKILKILDGMNLPYYVWKAEQRVGHLRSLAN